MLKILTTNQVREVDAYTIEHEPVSSINLMERACEAFVNWYIDRYPKKYSIIVVCGTGNNGGDGLGIARLLKEKGFSVSVVIVRLTKSQSRDFKENLDRIARKVKSITITDADPIEFPGSDILIDAIFGSGLSRPLSGFSTELIKAINNLDVHRISVDCPSGFLMDSVSLGESVRAHHTVTFQIPKLSFLLPQSYQYVGQWHLVDIGLNKNFIEGLASDYFLIDELAARSLYKMREKFDHKGTYGHALVLAGSMGKIGAAVLSTRAALRVGSGLVTAHLPKCGYSIMQSSAPEAMVISDTLDDRLSQLTDLTQFTSIGVGPGIGTAKETVVLLETLLQKSLNGLVLDADALNIISSNDRLLSLIPQNSILTPHPGEFRRLVGDWTDDFDRLKKQIELASKIKSIIILKGAHTSIAFPNGLLYFNNTGNPAMATGGSGDVLTGMITGLLAQGYGPFEAAILGVFIHGLAGDYAAKSKAVIIASDIIEEIPHALSHIHSTHQG